MSEFKPHRETILTGTVLAIDPSSGAYNRGKREQSHVGYALYRAGVLIDSGIVEMDGRALPDIWDRLRDLHDCLSTQFETPDVLVMEKIRGSFAHEYLKFSIPVIALAVRAPIVLEVNISTWKKYAGSEHQKSDEADAIAIGAALIKIVQE